LSHIAAGPQAANPPGNKLQYSQPQPAKSGQRTPRIILPMVAHPFGGALN
jgi:hypothetical protein